MSSDSHKRRFSDELGKENERGELGEEKMAKLFKLEESSEASESSTDETGDDNPSLTESDESRENSNCVTLVMETFRTHAHDEGSHRDRSGGPSTSDGSTTSEVPARSAVREPSQKEDWMAECPFCEEMVPAATIDDHAYHCTGIDDR